MSNSKSLPMVDRPCPKCGGEKAYGPEYRRGVKGDEGLGEHLRYYCTVCRYMTFEPTKDANTPERVRELVAAFEDRRQRWEGEKVDPTLRDREIEQVRRADSRRSQGWK
jgi:hypothetical protein